MCKANRKLEAFRYILTKFVAHQMKLASASSDKSMSREDAIRSFSNKRLMKLLYLLCLESVPSDCSNVGLFEIFDNMIAYPNGPVEQDVYDGLGLIKGVKYENGRLLSFNDNVDTREVLYNKEPYNKIDTAFKKLLNHIKGDCFSNTEYLINIVHSLYLWPKTYVSSSASKTMDIAIKDEHLNFPELEKEIKAYKEIFPN